MTAERIADSDLIIYFGKSYPVWDLLLRYQYWLLAAPNANESGQDARQTIAFLETLPLTSIVTSRVTETGNLVYAQVEPGT